MRGRKPTPTNLKVLNGESRPSRINKREPKHAPGAPGCPSWLPAEGKAEWRRIVPDLDRLGMLAKVDRAALAAYCQQWATLVQAQKEIDKRGLLVEGDGRIVKNPAVLAAKDAAAAVRLFASEFGLTPSSRARMEAPVAPPAAPGGQRGADRYLS